MGFSLPRTSFQRWVEAWVVLQWKYIRSAEGSSHWVCLLCKNILFRPEGTGLTGEAEPCFREPSATYINSQGLERGAWWALERSWKTSQRGWAWASKQRGRHIGRGQAWCRVEPQGGSLWVEEVEAVNRETQVCVLSDTWSHPDRGGPRARSYSGCENCFPAWREGKWDMHGCHWGFGKERKQGQRAEMDSPLASQSPRLSQLQNLLS